MAKARGPSVGKSVKEPGPKFSFRVLLSTSRQLFYFFYFILWLAIDISLLGLVSQQIHSHGKETSNWPTGQYQHAMGLLLFATIFSAIVGVFHAWLPLGMFLVIFLAIATFFGTGAGIIEQTPFGHGMQCGNPASSFSPKWAADLHWCSRVTAIEGLAWAMFALAVFGLFFAIFDKFSFTSRRNAIYDPELARAREAEKLDEHH